MKTAKTITVWLTAGAMGEASEADYDAWASWVAANVGELPGLEGLDVEVEQCAYGEAGDDAVSGADPEVRATVRDWLSHGGWDAFCATPEAWPAAA